MMWQDLFDEEFVSQDHILDGLGTRRLQGWTHIRLVPVIPAARQDQGAYPISSVALKTDLRCNHSVRCATLPKKRTPMPVI